MEIAGGKRGNEGNVLAVRSCELGHHRALHSIFSTIVGVFGLGPCVSLYNISKLVCSHIS